MKYLQGPCSDAGLIDSSTSWKPRMPNLGFRQFVNNSSIISAFTNKRQWRYPLRKPLFFSSSHVLYYYYKFKIAMAVNIAGLLMSKNLPTCRLVFLVRDKHATFFGSFGNV